jgi:citrate synthase
VPWKTGVSRIADNHVYVRGRPIDELMGTTSFAEMLLLLWTGRQPSPSDASLVEACLVAAIDHGPSSPSAQVARIASSTRQHPVVCLAAGLTTLSDYHGAALTSCMRMLAERPEILTDFESWAVEEVRLARQREARIPGVGHRAHTTDIRSERLLDLASQQGRRGGAISAVRALASAVSQHAGRPITVNIDGAMAACLTEIGLDPCYGDLMFALARSAGLSAHIVEERTRQRPMRTIDPTAVDYDGPPIPE